MSPHTVVLGRGVGVDVRGALNLVAALLKYLALAPLMPAAVALGYGEPFWFFLVTAAGWSAVGWGVERLTRTDATVGPREGFLVVALTWLLAAAIGATPYLLSGVEQLSNPVDAYFEAMSGFSTTGATVVTDVESLDRSLLLWRQFTQWLGGMGIIVLALAVLPRLRVGGRQLFESELPGPEVEPLALRIRDIARRLWLLYVALTALEITALCLVWALGLDDAMTPYDAVAHAFTTLPTGGFSTKGNSIEAFSAVTQWIVIGFIVVAGLNFALMYQALARRRPALLFRDQEVRLYMVLLVLAAGVLTIEIGTEELFGEEGSVRHAAFQAAAIMTGTGYASTDFNEWSSLALVTLVGLMFVGGSAGSTTGSVKVVRHLLLGKVLRRELDQTVHPELVQRVRLNGQIVDERTLRAVSSFILLYIGIFVVGALALVIDAARVDLELAPFHAVAAAAATLGNVGPALGFAGPMGSYEPFSDVSKVAMILLMWVGRLEIVPVVVLLTRNYWRA